MVYFVVFVIFAARSCLSWRTLTHGWFCSAAGSKPANVVSVMCQREGDWPRIDPKLGRYHLGTHHYVNRCRRLFAYICCGFRRGCEPPPVRQLGGCQGYGSLVSPVSLSLLQTLVIFPRSANINHQGTEISQPLSVLPHLGAWEKACFFQNDGLTECKITRFMLLPLTLLKMR